MVEAALGLTTGAMKKATYIPSDDVLWRHLVCAIPHADDVVRINTCCIC